MSSSELTKALVGTSVQFPGPEPDLRLGGDRDTLRAAVDGLAGDDVSRALLSEVVSHPSLKSPLSPTPPKSGGRRQILLGSVLEWDDDESGLVVVTIDVATTGKSFKPISELEFVLEVFEDNEIATRLELAYQEVPRAARSLIEARELTWLGGSAGVASGTPYEWDDEIRAVGAVRGFDVRVLAEPDRRVKDVERALLERPPAYLVHWVPHATGFSAVADRQRDEGIEVLAIESYMYAEALDEARVALDETINAAPAQSVPPSASETRFYIKGYGSKVGDKMLEVADCGHDDWGSNAKAKAPRAYKGAARAAGAEPVHLAQCGKCSKNRWRARF